MDAAYLHREKIGMCGVQDMVCCLAFKQAGVDAAYLHREKIGMCGVQDMVCCLAFKQAGALTTPACGPQMQGDRCEARRGRTFAQHA